MEEQEVNFFGELLAESSLEEDEALKQQLEKRAAIVNGELIFVDKDHWAIRID